MHFMHEVHKRRSLPPIGWDRAAPTTFARLPKAHPSRAASCELGDSRSDNATITTMRQEPELLHGRQIFLPARQPLASQLTAPPATIRHMGSSRSLLIVLGFTLVGAGIGSLLVGPYIGLTPGDPRGPSIAAGWGGFVGLGVGLFVRVCMALTPTHRP